MKMARVIGNNIKLLLQQKNLSYEKMGNELGFSEIEIAKICDGRLLTTAEDIQDIADIFGVEVD